MLKRFSAVLVTFIIVITSFSTALASFKDSDYDGVADEDEIALGMDPANPDTDGDGIPDLDDPTPKGSLVNVEEIWKLYRINIEISKPIATIGDTVFINATIDERSNQEHEGIAHLYVYMSPNNYRFDLDETQKADIHDNRAVWTYTTKAPGICYFVVLVNTSGLSIGEIGTFEEVRSLAKARRCSYETMPVYHDRFATIDGRYRDLLEGHTGSFDIRLWEFAPLNTSWEFLEQFRGSYNPEGKMNTLYKPISGDIYIDTDVDYRNNDKKIHVSEGGLVYKERFAEARWYSVKVCAYPFDKKWDYNFYSDLHEQYAAVDVHGRDIAWVEGGGEFNMGDTLTFSAYRVTIQGSLTEELFETLYYSEGFLGIAKNHANFVKPWQGQTTLVLLYTSGDLAIEVAEHGEFINGKISLSYKTEVPGSYLGACYFTKFMGFSQSKAFDMEKYWDTDPFDTVDFDVITRYASLMVLPKTDHYSNEEVKVKTAIFDGEKQRDDLRFQVHLARSKLVISKNGRESFNWDFMASYSGSTDFNLGQLFANNYMLVAIPIFNHETGRIADLFGPEELSGNWIPRQYLTVRNLSISWVSTNGRSNSDNTYRVIVKNHLNEPVVGATVKLGYCLPNHQVLTSVIFTGTTDSAGSVVVKDISFSSSYNRQPMVQVITSGGIQDHLKVSTGNVGSRQVGTFTVDKTIYNPGDTIHVRAIVWDVNQERPYTKSTSVSVRDPYGRNKYSATIPLNEYGVGGANITLDDELPWGRYRVMVDYCGQQTIDVKVYDLPTVKIELDLAEDFYCEAGDIVTLPITVKQMTGQEVLEGWVNYTITGKKMTYRNYWVPYEEYWEDDVDYGVEYDRRSDSYNGNYRYYQNWAPGEQIEFELEGHRELVDGKTKIKFTVPSGIRYITVDLEYSDAHNHTAELGRTILVGETTLAQSTKSMNLHVDKNGYTPDEVVTIEFSITSTALDGKVTYLPNIDFRLNISATDVYNRDHYLFEGELSTPSNGIYKTTISSLDISLYDLFMEQVYSYSVIATLLDEDLRIDLPDETQVKFEVYKESFKISTEKVDFSANEDVNIDITLWDYYEKDYIPCTWKLFIYPEYKASLGGMEYGWMRSTPSMGGTIVSPESSQGIGQGYGNTDYYYDYYRYDRYGSLNNIHYMTERSQSQNVERCTWNLPNYIEYGTYDIMVVFYDDDGNELKSLTHSIQVLGNEPEDFSLSSSVDHFVPGDDIKVTASFKRELSTYVFFDIHTRDGDVFDEKLASGSTLDFNFVAPDQLSPVSMDVYYMDDRGRIIKKFLVIMPDYDRLTVTVETDKEVYLPGDIANVTVRVLDINGDPVDDAFVAITITDAAVFELVAGGNESAWFASMG